MKNTIKKVWRWGIGLLMTETMLYLIFGFFTTVISISTYWVFQTKFAIHYSAANVLSWIIAVTFAYITNKYIVFRAKSTHGIALISELISFMSARLISLAIEEFGLFILIDCLIVNKTLSKLIMQVFIVIINYILSKVIIFRK